jgi:hypothetical protein
LVYVRMASFPTVLRRRYGITDICLIEGYVSNFKDGCPSVL